MVNARVSSQLRLVFKNGRKLDVPLVKVVTEWLETRRWQKEYLDDIKQGRKYPVKDWALLLNLYHKITKEGRMI